MANNMGAIFQGELLEFILNAKPIPNIGDNAGGSPLTNLYIALHTADPTNSGNQSSSEISYTGYARANIARSSGSPAWTISGANPAAASPNAAIVFPASTGGVGGTATFASVGTAASGTGKILFSGALSPSIVVTSGVTPAITTASTVISLD